MTVLIVDVTGKTTRFDGVEVTLLSDRISLCEPSTGIMHTFILRNVICYTTSRDYRVAHV